MNVSFQRTLTRRTVMICDATLLQQRDVLTIGGARFLSAFLVT